MCVICGCAECNAQTVDLIGGPGQVIGQFGQQYVLTGTKWGADEIGTGSGEITWSANLAGLVFNTTLFPTLTLADFEGVLEDAFAAWAEVARVTFREVGEGEDADIEIAMSGEDVGPFTFGEPFGTVAVASSLFTDGPVANGVSVMTDGFIFFDTAESWAPTGGVTNTVSFLSVAIHEIGHLLGLGHYDGSPQIMNSTVTTDFLQPGDIAGIQAIYGVREVGTDDDGFYDLSDEETGVVFSALDGDDVVTGSDGNDRIKGGDGDDELFGGEGNDWLVDTSGSNEISGGANHDTIIGGRGNLFAEGGMGRDTLIGGIGGDMLMGGMGADVLRGDPKNGFLFGNDTLYAGGGDDYLEGGGGADTFVFRTNEGNNKIAEIDINENAIEMIGRDFVAGIDRIDLSDFNFASFAELDDAIATHDGDTVFDALGTRITIVGVTEAELSAEDFIL
ncbi:MAG: matrixin family metalloprotease [Pseudomonadota bacterium]